MKKKMKPKKSLRSRKGTRARRNKFERETKAAQEHRNSLPIATILRRKGIIGALRDSKRINSKMERIYHDEMVAARKKHQKEEKERHLTITARLKEWMRSLNDRRRARQN